MSNKINYEILTAEQVADLLQVKNAKAVIRLCKRPEKPIPYFKLGKLYRFYKELILEHIRKISLEDYQEPKRKTDSAFYRKEMQRMERRKRVGA